MGLIEVLTRWLGKGPAQRPPPAKSAPTYRRTAQDEENEETAELLAIDII